MCRVPGAKNKVPGASAKCQCGTGTLQAHVAPAPGTRHLNDEALGTGTLWAHVAPGTRHLDDKALDIMTRRAP